MDDNTILRMPAIAVSYLAKPGYAQLLADLKGATISF